MIFDAVLRDARACQRIFRGEKGRCEVVISLAHENAHSAIFAERLAQVGGDVEIGIGVAPADAPIPVAAQAGNRLIFAIRDETEAPSRPGIDGRGVTGIDTVELGSLSGLSPALS
jgi:hypothetical protein